MDLRTSSRLVAEHHVLSLEGTVDLAATPRLHDILRQLARVAPPTPIVVDVDGVTVLDDAALGLLLGAAATARSNGQMFRLVCSDERVRGRLAETRFDRAVVVSSSLNAAIADGVDEVS